MHAPGHRRIRHRGEPLLTGVVMAETPKLRPCPLCGCEALGVEHPPHKHVFATFMPDHQGSYSIECPPCNLGLLADTEELATAAWNSRVAPTDSARIEELEHKLAAAQKEARVFYALSEERMGIIEATRLQLAEAQNNG